MRLLGVSCVCLLLLAAGSGRCLGHLLFDGLLVGFDETIWASLVQPGMTLIAQPMDEIGKTATELLLQRIADPRRSPRTVLLKGQLVVRGSSAPRHYSAEHNA